MHSLKGKVEAVCISTRKGEPKHDVGSGRLIPDHGLEGDAHAGKWHRQVSLLSLSSVEKMKALGLDVTYGSFAENLTISGFEVYKLPVGTRLRIGEQAVVEVTQIGKECHDRCAIYHTAGDCVMPREGIFVRVLQGGTVRKGDEVVVMSEQSNSAR